MKSLQTKNSLKPCICGSSEFVSSPNRYDIYEIIDGELELIDSPFICEYDDKIKLFCRNCGEELKNAEKFINA